MEEDRERDEKLKAERMAGAKKKADEMLEAAMKSAREGKASRWCPKPILHVLVSIAYTRESGYSTN
jgi:hypothetical protein